MKAIIHTYGVEPHEGTFELALDYVPLPHSKVAIGESDIGPVTVYTVESITLLLNRLEDGQLEQDGVAIAIRKL